MIELAVAFVATVLAEGVMGGFMGLSSKRFLICLVAINALTNIPLNILISILGEVAFLPFVVVVLEIVIFLVEGFFYRRFLKEYDRPFLLSLVLNGASLLAGLIASFALQ